MSMIRVYDLRTGESVNLSGPADRATGAAILAIVLCVAGILVFAFTHARRAPLPDGPAPAPVVSAE